VKTERLPNGSVLYFDAKGVMQSHLLAPGVLLHVRHGMMSADFAKVVADECDRQIAEAKRLVLMVDGFETTMHTSEFRETMTTWFKEHQHAVVHMLARSPMIKMSLMAANRQLGSDRVRVYQDVAEWEAVGRTVVRTFRRRPLELPPDFAKIREE
jgi:hypothetical protein